MCFEWFGIVDLTIIGGDSSDGEDDSGVNSGILESVVNSSDDVSSDDVSAGGFGRGNGVAALITGTATVTSSDACESSESESGMSSALYKTRIKT